jgi:hypothetical protein
VEAWSIPMQLNDSLPYITSVSPWTQSFQSEIGGSTFISNVSVNPQTYRASKPRRLISHLDLFTIGSFHAKSAQLTILSPLTYMKISEVWGIVDVNMHTSFEPLKDDSSEIVVVQSFYGAEILCF